MADTYMYMLYDVIKYYVYIRSIYNYINKPNLHRGDVRKCNLHVQPFQRLQKYNLHFPKPKHTLQNVTYAWMSPNFIHPVIWQKKGNPHHHRALCSWKGPPKQARGFKWSNFWRSCAQHEVAKVNVLKDRADQVDIEWYQNVNGIIYNTFIFKVPYQAVKCIKMPVCVSIWSERMWTNRNCSKQRGLLLLGISGNDQGNWNPKKTHWKTLAWLNKKSLHHWCCTLICPSKAKASSPVDFEWKDQMDPPIAALQLWWPLDATCLSSDQSLPCKFW